MFNMLFPKHWSTLKKLIWLKAAALSSAVQKTVTAAIVHIKDALAGPAQNVTIAIEPVQSGSGDPAPDNVRPITGWTGTNVTHTGANLLGDTALTAAILNTMPNATLDTTNKTISFNGSTDGTSNKKISGDLTFKANTQYTFINIDTTGAIGNIRWDYTDGTHDTSSDSTKGAYVSASGKTVKRLYKTNYGSTNVVLHYEKCGIFEGVKTVDDFQPYSYTTIPITFPDSAGTVYGGTLDVTNGVLTVDRAILKPTTMRSGAYSSASLYWPWFDLAGITADADVICDCLTRKNFTNFKTSVSFMMRNDYFVINPNGAGYSSSSAARDAGSQFITDYEPSFVYPLATPQTYQLTPQEVQLLAGENNLWADTGSTTLTYLADGRASDIEALGILLAGRYVNTGAADEATDAEALNILLGGNR